MDDEVLIEEGDTGDTGDTGDYIDREYPIFQPLPSVEEYDDVVDVVPSENIAVIPYNDDIMVFDEGEILDVNIESEDVDADDEDGTDNNDEDDSTDEPIVVPMSPAVDPDPVPEVEYDAEAGSPIPETDENLVPDPPLPSSYIYVWRTTRKIVDDYRPSSLQSLALNGATFYAMYDNDTEQTVTWDQIVEPTYDVSETINLEALQIADANNQHFWTDSNGAHVTDDEQDDWNTEYEKSNHGSLSSPTDQVPWHNLLMNSLGILLRRGLLNLVSVSKSAISFYDGLGNQDEDITAYFGRTSAQIGRTGAKHITLTAEGITAYNADGTVAPLQAANISAAEANIEQLQAATADISTIRANSAKVASLTADALTAATAYIAALNTLNVTANDISADKATLGSLITGSVTTDTLKAASAYISALNSANVTANDISANKATLGALIAGNVTTDTLRAASAYISSLTASNISASTLTADHANVTTIIADYLTSADIQAEQIRVGQLLAGYVETDFSNADVAWIENGTIKDGAITNAMINSVSANKLTAGTIDASNITVTNLNADNITTGTINGQRIGEGSLSLSKLEDDVYTESEVDSMLSAMQAEIDGAIETWTGTAVPTLNNTPASGWTTNAVKDTHVGDVYFVVNSQSQQNGYNYRFTKLGSGNSATYSWQLIKDNDVTNALQRITDAEGRIGTIETFDQSVTSWQTQTEGTISSMQSAHTTLAGRVDTAEGTLATKVDTSTFNTLSQTVEGNSSSITQLTTEQTTLNGLVSTALEDSVEYIVGTQSGASGAWTGVTREPSLVAGKTIAYKLPYNGSGNASLQLTLSDGTLTDNIPVYTNTTRVTTHFGAGAVITMTYDGQYWRTQSIPNSNNYDRTIHNNSIFSASQNATGKSYAVVASSVIGYISALNGYQTLLVGSVIDITRPILWGSANVAPSTAFTNAYEVIPSATIRNNTTSTWTGTQYSIAYIYGTLSNNSFTVVGFTSTVPTSEDGYIYLPLGQLADTYRVYFVTPKEKFAYIDGVFQPVELGVKSQVTKTITKVNEVVDTVDEHTQKIGSLETTVATKADNSTVTTVSNNLSTLSQTVNTFQSTVASTYATKESVDNIQVGGRNLLRSTPTVYNKTAYLVYKIPTSVSLDEFSAGDSITLQLWGVDLDSGSSGLRVYWGGPSVCITPTSFLPDANGHALVTIVILQTWLNHANASNKYIYVYNFPSNHTGSSLTMDHWKLEKGNKGTDWTPAPEEYDDKYATKTDSEADYLKTQSRGEQLITNGNGMMGDNTNFSLLTFDGSKTNGSPGSFTKSTGTNADIMVDEYFPVDPSKEYEASFDVLSSGDGANSRMYAQLVMYDSDKKRITIQCVSYFIDTTTTLAQALNEGDTSVYLTDATNWHDTSATHQRALIFWNYSNSSGYLYPVGTYSRNYYSNLYEGNSSVNKQTGQITLKTAWTGPNIPAGTPVSQGSSGNNYAYFWYDSDGTKIPVDEWLHISGLYSGMKGPQSSNSPMAPMDALWPGTAYCKIGWLWNYNSGTTGTQRRLWITNVSVKINNASAADVKSLTTRVTSAESTIEQHDASIALKANSADVYTKTQSDGLISTEVTNRNAAIQVAVDGINSTVSSTYATKQALSSAQSTLQGAIDAKADESDLTALTTRVSTAESTIEQHNTSIALKANSADVYTKTQSDGLISTEVTNRNAAIQVATEGITSMVSETYTSKEELSNALDSRVHDNDSWLYRQVPDDIQDGIATIESISGNTVVWNQLGPIAPVSNVSATSSVSDDVVTLTVKTGSGVKMTEHVKPNGLVLGHKYLALADVMPNSDDVIPVRVSSVVSGGTTALSDEVRVRAETVGSWTRVSTIGTLSSAPLYGFGIRVANAAAEDSTVTYKNFQLFNLTRMFGSGNEPSTVAEFERMFPEAYYPYNAGSLLSVNLTGVESVGFNQWDEEWEAGGINHTTGANTNVANVIRSKNHIPVIAGQNYYFNLLDGKPSAGMFAAVHYYDENKAFLSYDDSVTITNPTFTVPSGAYYMRFNTTIAYGAVYNHNICINLSNPALNGTYKPYTTYQRTIPASTYFPNGMRSVGTIHDELTSNAAITRVGAVDLGTLTWIKGNALSDGTGHTFRASYTSLSGLGNGDITCVCAELYCPPYKPTWENLTKGEIEKQTSSFIIGGDSSLTTSEFKASLSGVIAYIALATPVTTPVDLPLTYRVEQGGTERVTHTNLTAAPTIDILYGLSTIDSISDALLRVDSAESSIIQNATDISLKVSKNDVINQINVSTEGATINANRVNITGEAVFSAINNDTGTTKINGGKIDATAITIGQSQVTGLTTALNGKATPSDITTAINAIEVGGRNLLQYKVYNYADASGIIAVNNAYRGMYCAVTGGETYTISRKTIEGNRFWVEWSEEEPATGVALTSLSKVNDLLSLTVELPSEANWLFIYLSNQSDVINDGNIKVERGNKATDWTPAPEDVEAGISTVQSNLNASRVWYAVCDTAAATVSKVATISPATTDFTLEIGRMVNVRFVNTNTGAVASLTLNINGTGAKPIKNFYNGGVSNLSSAGYLKAASIITFKYDGTNWIADLTVNSTYNQGVSQLYNRIKAKTSITKESIIVGDANGYSMAAAGVSFDLSYPILWITVDLAVNGVNYANVFTSHYDRNLVTNHGFSSGTPNSVVYLVGTVTGNTFTLASSYLTTTVPTSENGYCYIPIGRLGDTSTGGNYFYFFCVDKPTLYTYKDGSFGPASIREASAAAKTATNYISLDSTGIRIANANPATATTYQHQTAVNTEFIVDGVSSAEFSGSGGRIGSYNGIYTVLNNNQLTLAGYANKIFSVEVEDVTPVPEGDDPFESVTETSATVSRASGVTDWYISINQLWIPFIRSITSSNNTLVENTDYILNKVDGTIYVRSGINTVTINYYGIPTKDYNTSLTLYDGKGIGTNNKLLEISNDSAIIGKPNKSHLRLDYHSMQMIDANGTPYLYVSDLRDSNGEYEITETRVSDGSTRLFLLGYGPAVNTNYEVVIDDEDTYQITKEAYQFRIDKNVPYGVTITVTYLSSDPSLKAFTFGSRNPNYNVGIHSFAIGSYVAASKSYSYALGSNAKAIGSASFSMGSSCEASGYEAFALGDRTEASGGISYAEGYRTVSSGYVSHAEGHHSIASGETSHAEGLENTASGEYSHAEGSYNEASWSSAHVEGRNSISRAVASHAQNISTIASADGQTVLGIYNQEDPSVIVDSFTGDGSSYYFTLSKQISRMFSVEVDGESVNNFTASGQTLYFQDTPSNGSVIVATYRTYSTTHPTGGPYGEYAVIVGNGTGENARSNALTVDWSGNVDISGGLDSNGAIISSDTLQAHDGREIFGGTSGSVLLQHKDANNAEDFRIQFYIDSNGHPALRGSLDGGTNWEYPYANQYASRTANTVWAAPNGSAGAASFRALVAADIPNLNASKITAGSLDIPGSVTSDGAITSGAAIYAHDGQEIFGGTDALIRLYHKANNSEDFRFDFYIDGNGNPAIRASLDAGSSWKYPYLNQLSSRTANTVLAGPNGSNGAPSFRALVADDIPNLNASKITAGTLGTARGGTGVSGRQSSTITVDTSNVTVGDTNYCWHNGVVCSFSYNFKTKASLANNGTLTVGTLPSGYRPPYTFVGSAYTSTASAQADVTISTGGVITIRNVSGAAIATSVTIRVGATFAL